jgi:hypothetical protein
MLSSVSAIIKIFAYGIFACSAILLVIGSLAVVSGAATGNASLVGNGWGLVGVGVVLFVLALIAWAYVRTSGD